MVSVLVVEVNMPALSKQERARKLLALAESEGYERNADGVFAMLEKSTYDSVVPGACTTCSYTCECEPDARRNYCEGCGGQTVQSCLTLAGLC